MGNTPPHFPDRRIITLNYFVLGLLLIGATLYLNHLNDKALSKAPMYIDYIVIVCIAALCGICANLILQFLRLTVINVSDLRHLFFLSTIIIADIIVVYAVVYRIFGIHEVSLPGNTQSLNDNDCIYFSVVTLTTLGFGDFVPLPGLSRVAAATEAITGYLSLAYFAALAQKALKNN